MTMTLDERLRKAFQNQDQHEAILALRAGANPNLIIGDDTPLTLAARTKKWFPTLLELVEKRADPNLLPSPNTKPALASMFERKGTQSTILNLLGLGANPNVTIKLSDDRLEMPVLGVALEGTSLQPLDDRIKMADQDVLRQMLECGADITTIPYSLKLPLLKLRPDLLTLALEYGANLNTPHNKEVLGALKEWERLGYTPPPDHSTWDSPFMQQVEAQFYRLAMETQFGNFPNAIQACRNSVRAFEAAVEESGREWQNLKARMHGQDAVKWQAEDWLAANGRPNTQLRRFLAAQVFPQMLKVEFWQSPEEAQTVLKALQPGWQHCYAADIERFTLESFLSPLCQWRERVATAAPEGASAQPRR